MAGLEGGGSDGGFSTLSDPAQTPI